MSARPITLLIAALGGEGGGVLTDWIVRAASECGYPVQSTSIPGVAQRTGATTYYVEIFPQTRDELGGRRPVLALTPGVGDIDVVLASELMEAGRTIAGGFVTPDRTLVIASTSRFFTINEKSALGDGRYDSQHLAKAVETNAQAALLFDMEALARRSRAMINAVMLGALAGSGRLPIPAEAFEAAIRHDGKAVDSNLAGLRAGLQAARDGAAMADAAFAGKRRAGGTADLAGLEAEAAGLPESAHAIVVEGLRRLAAYQDLRYARLYLDRLGPVRAADARAGAGGQVLRETARHLAVRMSFEDVIRVAEAKIDPARMRRIADELQAGPDEPFAVYDFLKPGVEEFCQVLPPRLAKPLLGLAGRRGWLHKFHLGMEVNSTAIGGYLRFWMLARLKPWRPRSHRYLEEQPQIEAWLGLVVDAAAISAELALEVAECARLIKGYGDTHRRGLDNFRAIEARVIRPALAGNVPPQRAADGVASARTAALVDPEGESLARCLAQLDERTDFPVAAE